MLLQVVPVIRSLAAALAVGSCVGAWAQVPAIPKERGGLPILTHMSEEDRAKGIAIGESIARQLLEAYEKGVTPAMVEETARIRQNFDDIADAALSSERKKVLDFLGLDPEAPTGLYILVSWSMPLELLRSYAIEAMWSGATLVFRGVPPGRELAKFLTEDLRSLVYGKGASANISIDPRLFDAFSVKVAPTVVFSKVRNDFQCQGVHPVGFKYGEKTLSHDICPPLDPSNYHKIAGNVSLNYALQTILDDGDVSVRPYMRALARGFANGTVPGKTQVSFQGKWEDAMSPEQQKAALEAAGWTIPKDGKPVKKQ